MRHTFCFLYGVWFSLLQYYCFLALESGLSASTISYLIVTFSWLTGTWVGLRWGQPALRPFHTLLSLSAYFGILLTVQRFPFDQRLLPLEALGVAVAGWTVGIFFRSYATHFRQAKTLFLIENNGFIAGLFVALWGFLEWGRVFMLAAPLTLCLSLCVLDWVMEFRARQTLSAMSAVRLPAFPKALKNKSSNDRCSERTTRYET